MKKGMKSIRWRSLGVLLTKGAHGGKQHRVICRDSVRNSKIRIGVSGCGLSGN